MTGQPAPALLNPISVLDVIFSMASFDLDEWQLLNILFQIVESIAGFDFLRKRSFCSFLKESSKVRQSLTNFSSWLSIDVEQ